MNEWIRDTLTKWCENADRETLDAMTAVIAKEWLMRDTMYQFDSVEVEMRANFTNRNQPSNTSIDVFIRCTGIGSHKRITT